MAKALGACCTAKGTASSTDTSVLPATQPTSLKTLAHASFIPIDDRLTPLEWFFPKQSIHPLSPSTYFSNQQLPG